MDRAYARLGGAAPVYARPMPAGAPGGGGGRSGALKNGGAMSLSAMKRASGEVDSPPHAASHHVAQPPSLFDGLRLAAPPPPLGGAACPRAPGWACAAACGERICLSAACVRGLGENHAAGAAGGARPVETGTPALFAATAGCGAGMDAQHADLFAGLEPVPTPPARARTDSAVAHVLAAFRPAHAQRPALEPQLGAGPPIYAAGSAAGLAMHGRVVGHVACAPPVPAERMHGAPPSLGLGMDATNATSADPPPLFAGLQLLPDAQPPPATPVHSAEFAFAAPLFAGLHLLPGTPSDPLPDPLPDPLRQLPGAAVPPSDEGAGGATATPLTVHQRPGAPPPARASVSCSAAPAIAGAVDKAAHATAAPAGAALVEGEVGELSMFAGLTVPAGKTAADGVRARHGEPVSAARATARGRAARAGSAAARLRTQPTPGADGLCLADASGDGFLSADLCASSGDDDDNDAAAAAGADAAACAAACSRADGGVHVPLAPRALAPCLGACKGACARAAGGGQSQL